MIVFVSVNNVSEELQNTYTDLPNLQRRAEYRLYEIYMYLIQWFSARKLIPLAAVELSKDEVPGGMPYGLYIKMGSVFELNQLDKDEVYNTYRTGSIGYFERDKNLFSGNQIQLPNDPLRGKAIGEAHY